MRLLFLIMLLCCNAVLAQSQARVAPDTNATALKPLAQDTWIGKDKADHLLASAFLAGAQYYALRREFDWSHERSVNIAVSSTLVIGLGKEIYDHVSRKGTPSVKDLAADVLGIAVAATLLSR